MRKIASTFCLLATFCAADLHVALVQVWAWGNMFSEYSQDQSLVEAAKSAVEGEEGCLYCAVVQRVDKETEEGTEGVSLELSRLRFFSQATVFVFPPRSRGEKLRAEDALCRGHDPLSPPIPPS